MADLPTTGWPIVDHCVEPTQKARPNPCGPHTWATCVSHVVAHVPAMGADTVGVSCGDGRIDRRSTRWYVSTLSEVSVGYRAARAF